METQDPPKQIAQNGHRIPADSSVHFFSKVHSHIGPSELIWGITRETSLKKVTWKFSSGNLSSAMNSLLLKAKCVHFSLSGKTKQNKKGISPFLPSKILSF